MIPINDAEVEHVGQLVVPLDLSNNPIISGYTLYLVSLRLDICKALYRN